MAEKSVSTDTSLYRYRIPRIPMSLNKFIGRKNVWEYREEKKNWKDLCFAYCKPRPSKPIDKANVILTFYFSDRRRHDADNYQKMLLDGLVYAGIIADDDFGHITVTCKGGYDKARPRVEIEVEEI